MPRQYCDLLGLASLPLGHAAEGISYFRLLRLKSYSLKENGGILRCLFFHLLIENSAEHFKKLKIDPICHFPHLSGPPLLGKSIHRSFSPPPFNSPKFFF